MLGNTMFDDPVSVNFPILFASKLSVATKRKEDMSFETMAKRTKERIQIYTYMADSLVDGEVDFFLEI